MEGRGQREERKGEWREEGKGKRGKGGKRAKGKGERGILDPKGLHIFHYLDYLGYMHATGDGKILKQTKKK